MGVATYLMLLPDGYQNTALSGCHDDVGHMGRDRTLSLLRERFYWPSMAEDVASYVSKCGRCFRRKAIPHRASLVNVNTTQPLEMICVDFFIFGSFKGRYREYSGGHRSFYQVFSSFSNTQSDSENYCSYFV